MKGIILILILFLLLTSFTYANDKAYDCKTLGVRGLCISVIFKSDSDKGDNFKNFKFPYNLKQGDKFWIDKIIVYNKDNNLTQKANYIIDMHPSGGHITDIYPSNYGRYDIRIPSLKPNDKYELIYNEKGGEFISFLNNEEYNITVSHWKIDLYKHGEWIITEDIEGESGFTSLFNGAWRNNLMLVQSGTVRRIFNLSLDILIGIATVILMILSIIISVIVAKRTIKWQIKEKKEYEEGVQEDLLKSIETKMRCIKRDVAGHKEELNKNPPVVPSYYLTKLNANFYLTTLRYKIKGHESETLKEWITIVDDKIININRLIELAQNYDSTINSNTLKNQHVKELKDKNYKYYKDLINFINNLKTSLNKILYFKAKKA